MGLKVVALDLASEKLTLARRTGADLALDARSPDAIAEALDRLLAYDAEQREAASATA